MKVSYNWLKQYMDLSDITPEQLAEAVTRGGHEVEGSEKMAYGTNLVIGEVLTCENHPDSDHLHVTTVNVGDEVKNIVCGAPNVAAGQKVIVALPGCKLPGGEIKSGSIRGQKSDGMICALFELGVDKKSLTEEQLSGIEVLPADAPVGEKDVLGYLGLDDTIFDVSLTPNRADCLAIWSFAKDAGALINKQVNLPDYSYSCQTVPATLKVASETPKCPLFEGKIINHVTIKPSPKWMQQALNAAGVKSINNVVDISNYVMLETGQPLHFYDLAKVPAREITVKSDLTETYTALDGIDYNITSDDIVITTAGNTIGIAGIMGGDDSKIDENTTGIIIEAADFNSVQIRTTARRLNLETEAAMRFTKGIDPQGGHKAVERSVQLLLEYADATGVEETVVYGSNGYVPYTVDASVAKINGLLGTTFTSQQMYGVFEKLDFKPEMVDEDKIVCHIPSYRTDIKIWQDLSEEVIRMLGYDNIVTTLPKMPTTQGAYAHLGKQKRTIQAMLNGQGLSEVLTYSLVSQAHIDAGILTIGTPVRIANAASEERRYYRTSLLPSLLDVVSYNIAHSNDEFGLFETSYVYSNEGAKAMHLSLALSEKSTYSLWQKQVSNNDFYTVKGLILAILDKLGYDEKRVTLKPIANHNNLLHPNKSADIYLGKTLVGSFGHIHPKAAAKYDAKGVVLAELDLDAICDQKNSKIKYVPVAKYPGVSYDLALVVKEEVSGADIVNTIKKAANNLLKDVTIFDIYRGVGINPGYKSVAVSVMYQSADKTLSESDIAPVQAGVIEQLKKKLDATLRD